MSRLILALFFLLFLYSCKDESPQSGAVSETEYEITRRTNDKRWVLPHPIKQPLPTYSWQKKWSHDIPPITKEYFRCNGSYMNPPKIQVNKNNQLIRIDDCGGPSSHSLPLLEGQEFVYPVLIDLLNYIQKETGKKVVVTCGHRCPNHHMYARDERQTRYSKHMIGAEVAFYVQDMEEYPLDIVGLLMDYYRKNPNYQSEQEYLSFERYTKGDTDVAILPWYNKEIFIKIYSSDEGRDLDNRHPYPYIRVQVRYDRDKDKRVLFNWDEAEKNYHRN